MPDPIPQAGPVDLDALDAFLMSDGAPEDGMGLSDLDGFLTGIVVGPEVIQPSEWLPVVWGGEEPAFESADEARSVLGTIMGRYNEIARALDAAPDDFDPVFWEGLDGQVTVNDWAAGFLDAVALRPKSWEPLIRHSEARVLMVPLLVLGADDPAHPPFGGPSLREAAIEQMHAIGAEIIPDCVVGIHAFWQERRVRLGAGGPRRPAGSTTRPRRQ
jgi:uncharacterized protein